MFPFDTLLRGRPPRRRRGTDFLALKWSLEVKGDDTPRAHPLILLHRNLPPSIINLSETVSIKFIQKWQLPRYRTLPAFRGPKFLHTCNFISIQNTCREVSSTRATYYLHLGSHKCTISLESLQKFLEVLESFWEFFEVLESLQKSLKVFKSF